jgi:hypothetical protein
LGAEPARRAARPLPEHTPDCAFRRGERIRPHAWVSKQHYPEDRDADTIPSTHVEKRFTAADWGDDAKRGQLTFTIHNVTSARYLRLRGTNLAINTPGQTDADGSPLVDNGGANADTEA